MFADIIASLFDSSEARMACNALTRSAEETSWEASNAALAALAIERESVSDISGDMGRYPSAGRDAMTIAVVEGRNQNPIRTRLLLPSVCSKFYELGCRASRSEAGGHRHRRPVERQVRLTKHTVSPHADHHRYAYRSHSFALHFSVLFLNQSSLPPTTLSTPIDFLSGLHFSSAPFLPSVYLLLYFNYIHAFH